MKKNNTFVLDDRDDSRFSCTFTNCQRGSQNVVYKVVTDDGKVYIGNCGTEGIIGRLRNYPHENSAVWERISEHGHCTVYALGYEVDTKRRFLFENKHIFMEAKRLLAEKGFMGNYSPSQVNMLMKQVSDKLINKKLDRSVSLAYALNHNLI